MASETTDRTGPLTKMQYAMLLGLMQGKTHAEIGSEHGKSKTHTSNIISAATAKMGCRKATQAVAQMSTHFAYLEAAELLENSLVDFPVNAREKHLNRVMAGLIGIFRQRAAALLPS